MICLLVFICCLAAVTALTVGMVLKVVTTLVEASGYRGSGTA